MTPAVVVVVVAVGRAGEEELHPAGALFLPPGGEKDDDDDDIVVRGFGGSPSVFPSPRFSCAAAVGFFVVVPSPGAIENPTVDGFTPNDAENGVTELPGTLPAKDRWAPMVVGEVVEPERVEGMDENECGG